MKKFCFAGATFMRDTNLAVAAVRHARSCACRTFYRSNAGLVMDSYLEIAAL